MFDTILEGPPDAAYVPSVVDALLSPDDVAGWLATAVPGPVTAQLIGLLNPVALTAQARVDLLVATERLASWVAAVSHRTVAVMAAEAAPLDESLDPAGHLLNMDDVERESFLRESLMCALRLSGRAADNRAAVALTLAGPLRDTLAALQAGTVTAYQAVLLAGEPSVLPSRLQTAVQDRVLPAAPEQSYAQFRRALRRAIAAVDTREAAEQHAAAVTERRVVKTAQADGMATIWALLPADGAELVYAALTAMADQACGTDGTDQAGGDGRLVDQRRADARACQMVCVSGSVPAEGTMT